MIYAIDTETTGLQPYKKDKILCTAVWSEARQFVCDGVNDEVRTILGDPTNTVFMHNAKFDWRFFNQVGVTVNAKIICTMALARLMKSDLHSLSLANLGALIGHAKDDSVKKYLDKNKHYVMEIPTGKKQKRKNYDFSKVPREILHPYALQDTKVTYELGLHEHKILEEISNNTPPNLPNVKDVVINENKLTRVLFKMEHEGVKINHDYVEHQRRKEVFNYMTAVKKIENLTGVRPFSDSRFYYAPAFKKAGVPVPTTDKGNPTFAKSVLEPLKTPLSEAILAYRKAYKRANTYYQSYIDLVGNDGLIHCNFRQAGAYHGRMSCSDPNLQNVPKESVDAEDLEDAALIRRCFIPKRDLFAMLDYDQMEYRLMLDYAREMEMIEQVKSGVDVHTAAAELMRVDRFTAKVINFMLLYGGGAGKLAETLGISLNDAKDLKRLFFAKLPNVKQFFNNATRTAETRGYIFNWLGRRVYIPKDKPYVAANSLIAGGCADIMKVAMVRVDALLDDFESKMCLNVHDEIVLDMVRGEENVLPLVRKIMVDAYPHKYLPMSVGIDVSYTSWSDKKPYEHDTA